MFTDLFGETLCDFVLNGEEVRYVPGSAKYAVSRCGNVWGRRGRRPYKSGRTLTGKVSKWNTWIRLTPWFDDGYPWVSLFEHGRKTNKAVHVLVLSAWVGPPSDGQECLHNDGDRTNCNVDNLRWGTRKENEQDKKRHGRGNDGEKHYAAKLTDAEAAICRQLRARHPGKRTGIIQFMSRWFGVSASTMSSVTKGKVYAVSRN